jgi:predicted RNA-binding Zn-ribbon protein involved in translation (DUF1610 family)
MWNGDLYKRVQGIEESTNLMPMPLKISGRQSLVYAILLGATFSVFLLTCVTSGVVLQFGAHAVVVRKGYFIVIRGDYQRAIGIFTRGFIDANLMPRCASDREILQFVDIFGRDGLIQRRWGVYTEFQRPFRTLWGKPCVVWFHWVSAWTIAVLGALPGGAYLCKKFLNAMAAKRLTRYGHCPSCNYNLTGNTSGICPECGTTIRANFRTHALSEDVWGQ